MLSDYVFKNRAASRKIDFLNLKSRFAIYLTVFPSVKVGYHTLLRDTATLKSITSRNDFIKNPNSGLKITQDCRGIFYDANCNQLCRRYLFQAAFETFLGMMRISYVEAIRESW